MIYVIVGPTASGKSALAEKLAESLNCDIINADAFQIYKDMDIGTNKIAKDDKNYSRYHLLDIVTPIESFSVKQYQDIFRPTLDKLLNNNKNVIVCGGTGLYIKASLYDYEFNEEGSDNTPDYSDLSNVELFNRLKDVDSEAASKIHPNNRKRVIRALNIFMNNNVSKSEIINSQSHQLIYKDVKFIFINPPRDELYKMIELRVDHMIDTGLIDEVKALLNKYNLSTTAKQGIGYKEIIDYLNGNIAKDDAIELIKKRTRNYAKRQVTFFKNQFEYSEYTNIEQAYKEIIGE